MDFSVDFFKDEVRNGFYIPTAIKQAWAGNLCVLFEIDRICRKYGITYFADWGSILGAVRHGGYVPWDDDLDICMKREDYNRFREVADKELPENFAFHDFRNKEDHWLFLARVVNTNHICFDEEHLKKYHNFPYIAVVDIFIKDYLYRDEAKERARCDEIKKLIAVADGIVADVFSKETVARELAAIEKKYSINIDRKLMPRDIGIIIYGIAEEQMARVSEDEADNIGQMFPFVLRGDRGLPKEYYDKVIRLPFENTTIPVPERYNEMLRNRYGDYLKIRKVWGGHNYPYFEGQRKNLQEVADFSLPEFTFSSDMLLPVDRKTSEEDSLTGMSGSVIAQFKDMNRQLKELINNREYNDVLSLMPEVQQFLVDYTTLVENVKGENRSSTLELVNAVQNYCDVLYEMYLELNHTGEENIIEIAPDVLQGMSEKLAVAFDKVVDMINSNVINRKEILFLTVGAKEWKSFDPIYRMYMDKTDHDVYVVPVPMFFKDIYGRVNVSEEDMRNAIDYDVYPDNIELTDWIGYSVELHRPDVIYIQNPYDGENPCLTIPAQFYAKNIRQYTEKLIYVPPFVTGEFGADDHNDMYNMKHYVTAPGVIYSDEVWVQSDNIRERYIEKLSGFAGKDTHTIWEDKIKVNDVAVSESGLTKCKNGFDSHEDYDVKRKKKLLYCIGLNEITEHDDVINRIKKKFKIFEDNRSNIKVDVTFFPEMGETWRAVNDKIADELIKLFDSFDGNDYLAVVNIDVMECEDIVCNYDAYYGSASPLVPIFVGEKKPVMIQDLGM